jgi:hypothetical protein
MHRIRWAPWTRPRSLLIDDVNGTTRGCGSDDNEEEVEEGGWGDKEVVVVIVGEGILHMGCDDDCINVRNDCND